MEERHPTMTMRYPGSFNSFVPRVTGQVISFVRDPKKYRINQYVQLVRSEASIGVYYKIHVDDGMRLEAPDEHVWHDGAMRPRWKHEGIRHDLVEFQTVRKDYGFTIGWKALKQADYQILFGYTAKARNQAMMDRTQEAITLLETTSNWGGHYATADALNGGAGQWDLASGDKSSPNYLAIKKTLDAALERVHLDTNGAVADYEEGDEPPFLLIISPRLALKMAQTSEIHDYLAQSPFALGQVKGRVKGQNARWGLPEELYGVCKIVVENAVRVSERPKADGSNAAITGSPAPRRFIKSNDSAILLCRPGSLDGQYGAPSFSTAQIYYYDKEMEVETFDENRDRLTDGHVTQDIKAVLTAPASGFLIQDCLSTE